MRPIEVVQRLQQVDRRVVYVVVVVVLAIPFVLNFSLPIYPDRYSTQTFEAIDHITRDPVEREKVVLIVSNWGPASEGENGPQLQYVIQHLLRRRVKFILCSTGDALAWAASEARLDMALRAERRRAFERGEPIPEFVYGEDYIKLGFNYSTVFEPIAKSLVLSTREFFQADVVERKPLTDENFPLLRSMHGVEDIALVFVVSAADEARTICGIVQRQVPDLKVATATMGITANDLYPYMRSGNLCGLLNSARAAAEYMSLLDPETPTTTPVENSMSLGKILLLLLVILGNIAFVITRRAERSGRLRPLPTYSKPMPDLPGKLLWTIGIAFAVVYLGSVAIELFRFTSTQTIPRERVAKVDDDPTRDYPLYERVQPQTLVAEQQQQLKDTPEAPASAAAGQSADRAAARARARADVAWYGLVEMRLGEFLAALLTLGIFAFLVGENPVYRTTESFMIGAAMSYYLLDTWDKMLWLRWLHPVVEGVQAGGSQRWQLLWLLMILPGTLWYFVYSKKRRWLNQLVIALFVGLVVGPEFGKQIGLLIPQLVDSVRPVWPFTDDLATNLKRIEQLVFVTVMVLSLIYFIFFLRPRTAFGKGIITAGRLVMMIGFGAMFGNTVNTRLSWLAPRIGYLLDEWLGKLFS